MNRGFLTFSWIILAALCQLHAANGEPPRIDLSCPGGSFSEFGGCVNVVESKSKPKDPCPGLILELKQTFLDEDEVKKEGAELERVGREMNRPFPPGITQMKIKNIETLREILVERAAGAHCKLPDLEVLKADTLRGNR